MINRFRKQKKICVYRSQLEMEADFKKVTGKDFVGCENIDSYPSQELFSYVEENTIWILYVLPLYEQREIFPYEKNNLPRIFFSNMSERDSKKDIYLKMSDWVKGNVEVTTFEDFRSLLSKSNFYFPEIRQNLILLYPYEGIADHCFWVRYLEDDEIKIRMITPWNNSLLWSYVMRYREEAFKMPFETKNLIWGLEEEDLTQFERTLNSK